MNKELASIIKRYKALYLTHNPCECENLASLGLLENHFAQIASDLEKNWTEYNYCQDYERASETAKAVIGYMIDDSELHLFYNQMEKLWEKNTISSADSIFLDLWMSEVSQGFSEGLAFEEVKKFAKEINPKAYYPEDESYQEMAQEYIKTRLNDYAFRLAAKDAFI